ncbi:MAG TPA: hypothetical protein VN922_06070 [Bacteroidia bacterium]|nr:hypothetical protein [Bacteroidia bacterium]
MKKLLESINTMGKAGRALLLLMISSIITLMPTLSYGQTPPPPTGGSGGGSLPDSPLGVPFDWKLNLLLAIAGIIFAVMVIRRKQKQKNEIGKMH